MSGCGRAAGRKLHPVRRRIRRPWAFITPDAPDGLTPIKSPCGCRVRRLPRGGSVEPERLRLHERFPVFVQLDIHLGGRLSLDEATIFDKLVTRKRGGWCYEMNSLLAWALRELGFGVPQSPQKTRVTALPESAQLASTPSSSPRRSGPSGHRPAPRRRAPAARGTR